MYIIEALMSYGLLGGVVVLLLGTAGIAWIKSMWTKGTSIMTNTTTNEFEGYKYDDRL